MHRLLQIGFEYVGAWTLAGGDLVFTLSRHASQRNVLYAFVFEGEIKYLGKTTKALSARMNGYRRPSSSQRTNLRNHLAILELIRDDKQVDILALPDNGLMHYGQFHLNLAAGLEDSLIEVLNPPWNGGRAERLQEEALEAAEVPTVNENKPPSAIVITQTDFTITLQRTYFNSGFFNPRVDVGERFGGDREKIEIFCGNATEPIVGLINRTANKSGVPRIYGGTQLRQWFQTNARELQTIGVRIASPTSIRVIACE